VVLGDIFPFKRIGNRAFLVHINAHLLLLKLIVARNTCQFCNTFVPFLHIQQFVGVRTHNVERDTRNICFRLYCHTLYLDRRIRLMFIDMRAAIDLIGCHEVVAPLGWPACLPLGSSQSVQLVVIVDFIGLFTACL
jgi:hypothetical protein